MRLRLMALVLIGAAIVAPGGRALASPPPSPTASGIGIRLVAVPGASRIDSLGSPYIVDRVAPGTSLTRRVEISNATRSRAEISVYPAAASIVGGGFAFAPGHNGNDLSGWTTASRAALGLAPRTSSLDTLVIDVPGNASPGERYGVVWAEVSLSPPTAGGVELVNRVGVRIYLSVGAGGAPPSNFAVGPLSAERTGTGEPVVVASVRNDGQATLDVNGTLTLSKGPGGLGAGPFAATLGSVLAPGVSEPVTVRLNRELPRGPWRADLGITSGPDHRAAGATITFPPVAGGAKTPGGPGVPWLTLTGAILLLSLTISAAALLVSRRRMGRMRLIR